MEAIRVKDDGGASQPETSWRQGDCALGRRHFPYVRAISALGSQGETEQAPAHEGVGWEICQGLVVLSQSCDIVRAAEDYPFVEVAPLVAADADRLAEIKGRRRPRYAVVPGVEADGLVADLGQVMSVSKETLEGLPRTVGCQDDFERRRFASAVAQKYSRFAFPDDFVEIVKPLRRRLVRRHGKSSLEGKAVSALYEVRVRAAPSWSESRIDVYFWFLWDDTDASTQGVDWAKWCGEWLGLISPSEKYRVEGQSAELGDLTARDYIESDALDLDHLSAEEPNPEHR